ncbi:MAG: tRNA (adenosine(37)-N6)-threonylcarbamoyltransferase complex dimerization subunit type 1 TsaB [Paludibacteraceae bacterium]
MTILCIETSTRICSAAWTIGGVPIEERIQTDGSNHAQYLPVFVDELLQVAKSKNLPVEAVALSEGPGSYTGLRIGTSMAKGVCYGLHVPLLPIPTLQVLTAACVAHMEQQPPADAWFCPMIDARRMEVYTALYDGDLQEQDKVQAKVVEDAQWLMDTKRQVYYFGDGADKCRDILASDSLHYIPNIRPEAKYMGLLAERLMATGYAGADVAYYEPFYLKEFVAAPSHVKGLTSVQHKDI